MHKQFKIQSSNYKEHGFDEQKIKMKKLSLRNISPLFVLTIFGIIFYQIENAIILLSEDKGELATDQLLMNSCTRFGNVVFAILCKIK